MSFTSISPSAASNVFLGPGNNRVFCPPEASESFLFHMREWSKYCTCLLAAIISGGNSCRSPDLYQIFFHEPYDAAQEEKLLSKPVFLLCLGIPGILNCHISPHTAFKNLLEFQLLSSYPYYGCHLFLCALPKAKLLRAHLSWKGLMFSRIQLTFLPLIAFLHGLK